MKKKADFGNYTLEKYANLIIDQMEENTSDFKSSLIDQPIIDGKKAKQYEIHAIVLDLPYVYNFCRRSIKVLSIICIYSRK